MKTVLTTLLIAFIMTGCGHKAQFEEDKIVANSSAPASLAKQKDISIAPQQNLNQPAIADTSKKIIKTGDISFETKNLYDTRKKIITSLRSLDGYVAEESETNDTYRRGLTLKLRVPSKNFDLLLDSVSGNAEKIDSKNVHTADVTTQFIDIKTSLNNQKLLEKRYQELLKRSNKMSDMLQIENKLTEIRTSIDSTQGTLNYLSRQVAYSTLEVSFYSQQTPQYTGTTLGDRLSSSLKSGWELIQGLFFGIIDIWPIVILTSIAYVLVKNWRMRRKTRVQNI
jgi:hypothetical protein